LGNLIKQANTSKQPSFFHIDATYKLMASGFLLLTLSTEWPTHRGKLVAIAVSLHEDTTASTKFIGVVKTTLRDKFCFNWEPVYVLSDGAESIQNAVNANFEHIRHLLCYFHLKKAIRRHIQTTKDASIKAKCLSKQPLILYGIDLLHKTRKEEDFELCWRLLKDHWTLKLEIPKEFILYFEKHYIKSDQKWHLAASFIGFLTFLWIL
jgi:hypothetical protein